MINGLQKNDYLLMLIEECNECAQAAAKLIRVREGRNMTPVSEVDAEKNLVEEISDVFLSVEQVIESEHISGQAIDLVKSMKMLRWKERQTGVSKIPNAGTYHIGGAGR